jgi:hypothetical protein
MRSKGCQCKVSDVGELIVGCGEFGLYPIRSVGKEKWQVLSARVSKVGEQPLLKGRSGIAVVKGRQVAVPSFPLFLSVSFRFEPWN